MYTKRTIDRGTKWVNDCQRQPASDKIRSPQPNSIADKTTMPQTLPDYLIIASALHKIGTEVTPSEVHGTLCGLLCANTSAAPDVWQNALWPNQASGDLLAAEANDIFKQAHDALWAGGKRNPAEAFDATVSGLPQR